MKRWVQHLSSPQIYATATAQSVLFGWHGGATDFRHLIQARRTSSDEMLCDPATLQRVYIHFLVDEIPVAGLADTIEAIHSITDFHQPATQSLLPAPRKATPIKITGRTLRQIVPIPME
jgi:hypothetical protein